jgi:uncharacterized protein YaiI (UPF0178 family)
VQLDADACSVADAIARTAPSHKQEAIVHIGA